MQKTKKITAVTLLIWLCWLVYACSYIGKVNYNASINQVMSFYKVDKDTAGLVGTFFFFAYGIGQVINGFFCKKYNLKWVVFGSLVIAGCANLLVALSSNFAFVKYVWLVNGFAMSVLWPCVVRFLAENLARKDMARATVVIGTSSAVGMFFVYGVSAVFAKINFKITFFIATAVLIGVALLWAFSSSKLIKGIKKEEQEEIPQKIQEKNLPHQGRFSKNLLVIVIVMFCFFGVATNLVKDGLTTWMPTILKEEYGFGDGISIILTLALPVVGMFGNAFATFTHKKIHDFILHDGGVFLISAILIGGVMAGLAVDYTWLSFAITLVGFTAVNFLVCSSNSLITSIFPLYMKGKVNSGLMAGVLNGCCYLGSMISSYGLGLLAKNYGWSVTFWVLFAVCALVALSATVYVIVKKLVERIKHAELTVED